ncbi:MAG: uracil-DNA glycosylase, partial [Oricola sp.]|nr:uracil-DNA glycosylase [Oricola sp.]
PGLRGANRTGRPFTGDWAGDLLYATMGKFGFTRGTYDSRADDGLELVNCLISNAVRCVPPENKPTLAEQKACQPFLSGLIEQLPNLKVILSLGKISHDAVVRTFGLKLSQAPFGHSAIHSLTDKLELIDCYHCSRYNTNTGRLTEEMFHQVFEAVCARL